MKHYRFVVMTHPKPGQQAELLRWYDAEHIPEVLGVPGFVAAQRFRHVRDETVPDESQTTPNLVIYEIESSDIQATMEALAKAREAARVTISPALDSARTFRALYEAAAPDVRAGEEGRGG
jgi:hypothetical protein